MKQVMNALDAGGDSDGGVREEKESVGRVSKEMFDELIWFSDERKNSVWMHGKKATGIAQKAANMVWGIWKRAGRNVMEDRLYLLDSIVKAGIIYRVEIWALEEIKIFERIQSRYCKITLGVRRTTPNYIWRRDLGIPTMEFLIRERALRYIKEMLKMEESRWPKIYVWRK
ncbi:hypothetical protein M0804_014865 [Polistes exclamans]|nr:hypothetical protein M0804_014865 [Polistes exclamans]